MSLTLAYLLLTFSCFGEDLIGKVVSVYDGDTITVLSGNTQHKIRLEGVDTPESKQPFGNKAKQAMAEMVFGKQVKVVWKKKDRYGRTLGHVYVNGKWTNLEMIKQGMAWHYKQYSKDQELASAEVEARKKRLGLWADKSRIAPWEWRKGNRNQTAKTKPKKLVPTDKALNATVYITKSGKKYHAPGCRYLKKTRKRVSLFEAQELGLTACKICGR
ncbi:thermonuclease family protein [Verrucomicrobia bacterium]|nr:thermonuclease family protein [Verrucomicrobiota bacterium]